jgi:hypothetical protein
MPLSGSSAKAPKKVLVSSLRTAASGFSGSSSRQCEAISAIGVRLACGGVDRSAPAAPCGGNNFV